MTVATMQIFISSWSDGNHWWTIRGRNVTVVQRSQTYLLMKCCL